MSRHKKLAIVGVVLALTTAACGGDETSDDGAVGSSSTTVEAIETTSETAGESTSSTEESSTSTTASTSSTAAADTTATDATAATTTDTTATDTTDTTGPSSTQSPETTVGPQTSEVAAEEPTTSSSVSIPEIAEEFIEPSEDELIEAVTRSLIDDQQSDTYPTSEPELRCVSASVVDEIGKDKLVEAGMNDDGTGSFSPAALAEPDQQKLVSAFLSCVNVENLFASQVGTGGNLDEMTARCLAREMNDNGLLEELIRPSILGVNAPPIDEQDADFQDTFLEAFRACLDFEDEMARGFMEDGVVSETSARCLANRMDEEGLLDRIMRTQITGVALTSDEDAEAQALMLDLARECLSEAEAERLSLG